MLITITYRLFQLGYILVALFGIGAIVAQLTNEPLTMQLSNTQLVLGKNGISGNAIIQETDQAFISIDRASSHAPAGVSNRTRLSDGVLRQRIQVMPATNGERIAMICYDLLYYSSLSLAFYALYRLFRNFHLGRYFFPENARYLRFAGWLLLLQALLGFGMTGLFLSGVKLTKMSLMTNGMGAASSAIHFPIELDGISLTLAVSMLVLGSIFQKATSLKNAHETIV
ncbi:MAG: hypothetical protein JWQ27_2319 [Ferruginibacter sp.]|nr:hypothetical protein [Ferruginibacter sp.]